MKRNGKGLLIILVALVLWLGFGSSAMAATSGTCGENLTWTLDDEGTLTISGEGPMYDYDFSPWYEETVETVIIQNGVTSIGEEAFSDCYGLTSVIIGDGVKTIGRYAFAHCRLSQIDIPDSVEKIGDHAFFDCGISKITISKNIKIIERAAFSGIALTEDLIIPEGVREIESEAFHDNENFDINVYLPSTIEYIGVGAMDSFFNATVYYNGTENQWNLLKTRIGDRNDNLLEITNVICNAPIPKQTSLATPQLLAVENTRSGVHVSWKEVDKAERYRVLYKTEGGSWVTAGDTMATGYEIVGLANGTKYTFTVRCMDPTGTDYLSDYNKTGKSIVYENTMSGTLGREIEWNLDDRGYLYLTGSGSCVYGNELSSFISRRDIRHVAIGEGITTLRNEMFADCENLETVSLPSTLENIYLEAFYNCRSLKECVIPSQVTEIGPDTFYGCTQLRNVEFPEGLTAIGTMAFSYCENLKAIYLPDSLRIIGENAFYRCSGMEEIVLPASMDSIGKRAFCGNSGVTRIVLPENITSIKSRTFDKCGSLESITIPVSVKSIESDAFWRCPNLKDVYYEGSSAEWSRIAIDYSYNGNDALKNAVIHYNSTVSRTYMGDCNNDRKVDTKDRVLLSRYLATKTVPSGQTFNKTNADIDGSGTITNKDRAILARHLANWTGYEDLSKLPAEVR